MSYLVLHIQIAIIIFRALFLNWPITTLISLTTAFSGLVVYANLAHCDPLLREEETNVKSSDQVYFLIFFLYLRNTLNKFFFILCKYKLELF